MNKVANVVGKAVIGMVFWVALILFFLLMSNKVFAATTINPDGVGQHEYTEILKNATDEDIKMLEQVVFNEAGRCDDWKLRIAVVETVLNRCLREGWPDTIANVCTQKNQFCCRTIKGATEMEMEGVSDAIEHVVHNGRTVLPDTDYVFFAIGKQKCAKDHIYLGDSRKWQHMWFGRSKT